jgi:hypothetical protein
MREERECGCGCYLMVRFSTKPSRASLVRLWDHHRIGGWRERRRDLSRTNPTNARRERLKTITLSNSAFLLFLVVTAGLLAWLWVLWSIGSCVSFSGYCIVAGWMRKTDEQNETQCSNVPRGVGCSTTEEKKSHNQKISPWRTKNWQFTVP